MDWSHNERITTSVDSECSQVETMPGQAKCDRIYDLKS